MNKAVEYNFVQTITYTDGTPEEVHNLEGAIFLYDELPFDASDKGRLIDWVRTQKQGDGEKCIDNILFKHRNDPSYTRERYKSIIHEVVDAWVVEYPC